jgi:hypothetical protein
MSKSFKKLAGGLNPVLGLGLGSVFGSLTKVPGRRKPAPVVELPDEMEVARKARNAEARKRRKGRASTVLSDYSYGDGV